MIRGTVSMVRRSWMVLLAFGMGCGDGAAPSAPSGDASGTSETAVSELTGEVVIDGSSTVLPISEAVAHEFRKTYPNVNVTVASSGTGGGFKRFVVGETDISDASRPIKLAEFEKCAENNISFIEVPVAYDGLTVATNMANDWVTQLTVDDLKKIFLESSAAKTWKDVNPEWPAEEIKIYAPGTDSGTFDYFKEVMDGNMRKDMSTNEDDNVLVTGVAAEKNAIGFFGASYYFENKDKLKAVPIVNPKTNKPVLPMPEAIESGDYAPFGRPLFIYVKEDSLKRPEFKKFVEFYIENGKAMAEKVQYVGLPAEIYELASKHVNERLTGTHFWDAEGKPREGGLPTLYVESNLLPVKQAEGN